MKFLRQFAHVLAIALISIGISAHATVVRLNTSSGPIDIELFDATAPRTVANFLAYVNSGAFNNSFIHRSIPGFIIQGGGYGWDSAANQPFSTPKNPPIANEFNASRSNVRGTIAMAKLGGDPNSATSEWFINLGNNAANLDTQNGGFTVFGRVTTASMVVVDAIAALPIVNAGANTAFTDLPIAKPITGTFIVRENLVNIAPAAVLDNPYRGLWWNPAEDGWGMSIAQRRNILFGAVYTYDNLGAPIWVVLGNCPLTNNRCTSPVFRVDGPTPPTVPWNATGKVVSTVGTATLDFTDINNATMVITINNVTNTKVLTRQVFANGIAPPTVDYSDLWWNPAEDGWGIAMVQQYDILFAAWYTYDVTGKPIWYVASRCPVTPTGCTSILYRVTGATSVTGPWNGANRVVTPVGDITFSFNSANAMTMRYKIGDITATRNIVRQEF